MRPRYRNSRSGQGRVLAIRATLLQPPPNVCKCGPARAAWSQAQLQTRSAASRLRWAQGASNSALTDSPLWMRRMASARAGAMDRTTSFGVRSSDGTGTVLVQTISSTSG
jgi:hypothetical protein